MVRTPGFLNPMGYSSAEEFQIDLQKLVKKAGFTPINQNIIDEVLAHNDEVVLEQSGVKGMRWGVRRSNPGTPQEVTLSIKPGKKIKAKGGAGHPATEDAIKAAVIRQKAKKSSTDALTNDELKDVVNRMNLEQNYHRLDPKVKRRGQAFTEDLVKEVGPGIALEVAKTKLGDKKDPRVAKGLQVAELIVKSRAAQSGGKKKKKK